MEPSRTHPPAFQRLAREIQEPIYRMGWESLRPIQTEAIHAILDTPSDLILAARTASGKTEAAFLPILSRIVEDPEGGIRAIYAGPLKALINDQFFRLERLCEHAEIAVHKWHGDVDRSARKRLLGDPTGVLLITPESIESLFINRSEKLSRLFSRLEYVVIDELHSFLGTERGAHLRSLTTRLARVSRRPIRRIGLSATLGDLSKAREWLRPGDPNSVQLIEDSERRAVRLRIRGYLNPFHAAVEPSDEPENSDLLRDLFDAFHGRSALIFGNRKRQIEKDADGLARLAKTRGATNWFRVHHGSLSRVEREDTEAALRSMEPIATLCSSTMEMGIDIGSVKEVGQIGAPLSTSSLHQRLGRSGRLPGEDSIMHMFIEEEEPTTSSQLVDRLFLGLLQAIAMTELMLQKWSEPPLIENSNLSTLVQQVMSVIRQKGGSTAVELHGELVESGGFPNVSRRQFLSVLRGMGQADLIEQAPEGLLILGLAGEKIVKSLDFYSAFQSPVEYRVAHGSRHIGNIDASSDLAGEEYLILAGRRWRILKVDVERLEVLVEPSPGGRAPRFASNSLVDAHPRVRQRMRQLLFVEEIPVYLDRTARRMLTDARRAARDAGMERGALLPHDPGIQWFTWTGSRIHRTLRALGEFFGGLKVEDEDVALIFPEATEAEVREVYRRFLTEVPSSLEIAARFPLQPMEKYERFLSNDLRIDSYARNLLDVEGAIGLLRETFGEEGSRAVETTARR